MASSLGIGSLIVREATADDSKLPGNVFVPIDLLKPILADLSMRGTVQVLRVHGSASPPTRCRVTCW